MPEPISESDLLALFNDLLREVRTCVYVNPSLNRYGLINYRIYDKEGDGKAKLDHVPDMFSVWVYARDVVSSTSNLR